MRNGTLLPQCNPIELKDFLSELHSGFAFLTCISQVRNGTLLPQCYPMELKEHIKSHGSAILNGMEEICLRPDAHIMA